MVEIVMFTGNSCGKCKGAKFNLSNLPQFAKENLNLIEKNVDEKEEYMNELKRYGLNTLPVFVINSGKPLVGFDENMGKIMEVLGL